MRIIIVFLISALLAAPAVHADTASAQKAFKEGAKLFENKEFAAAAKAFRTAYEEDPNWKVLYNLGQCEAASRRHGRAMEAFEKYLALGGDDISLERRNEVETELDRLRRMVGFIDISAPEGATILLDGEDRGAAPLAGRLMVAASVLHDLTVIHEGKELLQRKIQVSGMQSISVNIVASGETETTTAKISEASDEEKKLSDVPAGTDTPAPEKKRRPLVPVGVALAATGGATLIAGIITGAVALKRNNDLSDDCKNGCPDSFHDDNDAAWNLGVASNILLAAGGGMAATGLVLLFAGKRKYGNEKAATVRPALSNEYAGFTLTRSF